MVGVDLGAPSGMNQVAPGVLHIAVPFDERIQLRVDGVSVPSRPGFGVTTAFDITETGAGVLSYEPDLNRAWWRVAQTILWLAVLVVAAGARAPFSRRRGPELHEETLIDLSDATALGGVVAGEALGTLTWDEEDNIDAAPFTTELTEVGPPQSPPLDPLIDAPTQAPIDLSHDGVDAVTGAEPGDVPIEPPAGAPTRPHAVFDVPVADEGDDEDVDLASLVASVDDDAPTEPDEDHS